MLNDPFTFASRDDLARFLEAQVERLVQNLVRTQVLVRLYREISALPSLTANLQSPQGQNEDVLADLLRSSVVFVHATLEDFLRSIAAVLLPFSEESMLNEVPLVGTSGSGRPEKFFLGRLASHRGKTVLELIQESVRDHLLTTTYNDTTQIASLLRGLNIDVEKVRDAFPRLDELIRRRHQIVHRADRLEHRRDPHEAVEGIAAEQVEEWISVVQGFMATIISDIVGRHRGNV
jgi:hypothetical protein